MLLLKLVGILVLIFKWFKNGSFCENGLFEEKRKIFKARTYNQSGN